MEDIFNLVLIVVVLVISAVSSGAERRRRARRAGGETPHPPAPTGTSPVGRDTPAPTGQGGSRWKAPADEVRRFLETIEERISEAQEPRQTAAAEPPPTPVMRPTAEMTPDPRATRSHAFPVTPTAGTSAETTMPPPPGRAATIARRQYRAASTPGRSPQMTPAPPPMPVARLRPLAAGGGYHAIRRATATPVAVARIIGNRDALRRAVIAREILGPPRGLVR